MTRRGPKRSTSWPTHGWNKPFIKIAMAAGRETVARSQPNSALIGLRKLPKLCCTPVLRSTIQNEAPATSQP